MAQDKPEMTSEHLVLCVHGIGNQRPGETVDDVLGGAVAEHNHAHPDVKIVADETIVTMFEDKYVNFEETCSERSERYPGAGGTRTAGDGSTSKLPNTVNTVVHNVKKGEKPERVGSQKKFPMHIKRVRKQYDQQVETVMAEVYWADLSPEPKGAFATIFDLIKVITSIGYLALDNAANVKARVGYQAVAVFLWALVLGVVSLNATLLMGVLVLLLESTSLFDLNVDDSDSPGYEMLLAAIAGGTLVLGAIANSGRLGDIAWTIFGYARLLVFAVAGAGVFYFLPGAESVIAATAILTILFGQLIARSRWDLSLWRMFSVGTGFWGLFLLIWIPFVEPASTIISNCIDQKAPFCATIMSERYGGEAKQIFHFVKQLMLLLGISWLVALVCCLFTYVAWLFDRGALDDSAPKKQQRRMYATICSALVLLWSIMSASFWIGMQRAIKNFQTGVVAGKDCSTDGQVLANGGHCHEPPGILAAAFDNFIANLAVPMGVSVAFFLALAVVGIFVVIRRVMNKDVLFVLAEARPVIGRLLLNGAFQWVFALSTLGILAVTVAFRLKYDVAKPIDWMQSSQEFLGTYLAIVPLFLLGLALVVYQMRDLVAGGLGAFRDIVVYANNDKLQMDAGPENFPPRQKIERRFERVCKFMIEQVQPKRITVVCHSQGTVVSTRNIRKLLEDQVFKTKDGEQIELTLVTMGSPVTHLYRKYFPDAFCVEKQNFEGVTWYNIGRTDDFVGTYIENLDEINGGDKNVPPEASEYNLYVPAGGHPGYFTDPYVWQHFTNKIGFKLVD